MTEDNTSNKYTNMYWDLYHKNKDNYKYYEDIINDLKRKLSLYEKNNEYTGTIINLKNEYGFIENNSDKKHFYFKKDNCNFLTKLYQEVQYNLNMNEEYKISAYNIKLINMNEYDILNYEQTLHKPNIHEHNIHEQNIIINIKDVNNVTDVNNVNNVTDVNNVNNVNNDPNIDLIQNTENIWYMNGLGSNRKHKEYISGFTNWGLFIENNFVITCNKHGRNKLDKKLKINDLILWYMQGKGYVAILKVKEDIEILNRIDKVKINVGKIVLNNTLVCCEETKNECIKLWEEAEKKHNYHMWKIPVEFIIHVDKNKCITKEDINYSKKEWMGGFRGMLAIVPKGDWKNLVLKIYEKMKEMNILI